MSKISVVTPCFNEKDNVRLINAEIDKVFSSLPGYEYEHLFIDNGSTDGTDGELRRLAAADKRVKVILNNRNFGPLRSPVYGIMAAGGDAVIMIAADLEEPASAIPEMLAKWREGYSVVAGIRHGKDESLLMRATRRLFYSVMGGFADVEHIPNFTGFGLYDRKVVETLREFGDMIPYFRGIVAEMGFKRADVSYFQSARENGRTSTNFFRLYEVAMAGVINHTRAPLRLAAFLGFSMSAASFMVALGYLFYKLIYWNDFQMGIAPVVIGVFFLGSVQLTCLGIIGEYIGAIFAQVRRRPLVVERERINF